ncbi:hypothetical protein TNCV_1231521 [Trichonephila clavipes]|nr:hypothetical protein TNCV_1231521 [Trichonephila clavipes]
MVLATESRETETLSKNEVNALYKQLQDKFSRLETIQEEISVNYALRGTMSRYISPNKIRIFKQARMLSIHQHSQDKDGVLRVGGRLCNSDLNFECKFPVILPCNHKLTNLIVEYFHFKILPSRSTGLTISMKPITCEQIMGNLPKERVKGKFFPLIAVGLTLWTVLDQEQQTA